MKRKFLDTDHPMFRPLWVRVLIVGLCVGWAVLEFVTGSAFWGVLFLALGGYSAWGFFVDFPPPQDKSKDSDAG
jgi:hypothetical protein